MVDYNEKIAKKANLEFIMVSLDDQESSAVKWAKKEDFPWPTLLLPQYNKEKKNLGLIDSLGKMIVSIRRAQFRVYVNYSSVL